MSSESRLSGSDAAAPELSRDSQLCGGAEAAPELSSESRRPEGAASEDANLSSLDWESCVAPSTGGDPPETVEALEPGNGLETEVTSDRRSPWDVVVEPLSSVVPKSETVQSQSSGATVEQSLFEAPPTEVLAAAIAAQLDRLSINNMNEPQGTAVGRIRGALAQIKVAVDDLGGQLADRPQETTAAVRTSRPGGDVDSEILMTELPSSDTRYPADEARSNQEATGESCLEESRGGIYQSQFRRNVFTELMAMGVRSAENAILSEAECTWAKALIDENESYLDAAPAQNSAVQGPGTVDVSTGELCAALAEGCEAAFAMSCSHCSKACRDGQEATAICSSSFLREISWPPTQHQRDSNSCGLESALNIFAATAEGGNLI